MTDPDFADAAAYLVVDVPDTKPRTVRVNITVPEMTLRQPPCIPIRLFHLPTPFHTSSADSRLPSGMRKNPETHSAAIRRLFLKRVECAYGKTDRRTAMPVN